MTATGNGPTQAHTDRDHITLRIVYVALAYDYGDPARGRSFEHWNFYDSLRQMGHEIIYFDYPSILGKLGKRAMNLALWEVVRKERPDVLFFVPFNDEINPRVLDRITRETKTVTAAWFCDDHWRFDTLTRLYAPCLDWSITTAASALPKYAAMGYERVIRSQWACNTGLYTPSGRAMDYDVSFIGMAHGSRPQVIEQMQSAGLTMTVRGSGWPGGRLTQGMAIEVMARSRVCLNLSNASTPDQQGLAQQIKGRHFEIPGCGSLQLTDAVAGIEEYFVPGEEIVVASSVDDLVAKARYYIANPAERDAIADAGHQRALAEHTYERRFADIFSQIHARDPKASEWRPGHRETSVSDMATSSHRSRIGYPSTSILILNYNGREHIESCLTSILAFTDVPYDVIVIDNGSTDGSVEYLREVEFDGMTLVENAENLGCPAARAQGMTLARGEYVLFLDNDTVVTHGWLRRLVEHCEDDPSVGIMGPTTNFAGNRQRIVDEAPYDDSAGLVEFAEKLAKEHRGAVVAHDRVIGFCMLIRRAVVGIVGNCDGSFGTYGFEDDDYCWRATLAGFKVAVAMDVFVHHVGNQGNVKGVDDYIAVVPAAWAAFRDKWELPPDLDMEQYSRLRSVFALVRPFDPARDYIPLPDASTVRSLITRAP